MARAAGIASLVALTDLDEHEAAILLDAAGGDVEMAVSLHFGDQADEDLYWSDEEADRLLDEDLKRGAQEKTAEFINRVQTREQVAKSAAKKRDRKSRSKLRSAEAEALLKSADLADTRRAFGCDAQSPPQECPAARMASAGGGSGISALAEHDTSEASAAESDEDSDSSRDSSSSEEWVDEDW